MATSAAGRALLWTAGEVVNATTKRPHDIGICPAVNAGGVHLVRWIEVISGQCVYGTLGSVSWTFGYLSILSWLCAQLPQIVTNYQNSSVEGLALGFLLNWFMGDITNLLGCILTHQLPFQTLLACYYVLVDSVLMFQLVLYKILFPPRPPALIPTVGSYHPHVSQHPVLTPHPHSTPHSPTPSSPLIISRVAPNRDFQRSVLSIAILLGFISVVAGDPKSPPPSPPESDSTEILGQVFAWICCCFYLSSRLPQIYENHRRKSTQGINIALFTAALCGNSFYTIGILTNPLAHDHEERYEFLMNALPYLLGSAGTIMFDVIILSQYCHHYGREPVELDREAIKRYLTTDASWLSHRWNNIRRQLSELPFTFTVSIHRGVYRGYEQVVEGVDPQHEDNNVSTDEGLTRKRDKDTDISRLGRNYGTIS